MSKLHGNLFKDPPTILGMLKKLIISPHIDDEIIGCGGILDKDCFVYYCGIKEDNPFPDPVHRISPEAREQELKNVAEYLGFEYEINYDSLVNSYTLGDLKDKIEVLIQKVKPEMVFIPTPTSYNQDHKIVYDACMIALRPHDKNFFVKKVLRYEQVHTFIWPNSLGSFRPNYFVGIDIEKKIEAYRLHASQVRAFRSPEMVRALAKMRGAMSNMPCAEAFEILRWVD